MNLTGIRVVLRLALIFSLLAMPVFLGSVQAEPAESGVVQVFDHLYGQKGETARVRVITANNEAWFARCSVILAAKETIDFTSFIIKRDVFGRSLIGLLHRKAQDGVKIRLMVDGRGTGKMVRSMVGYDELQELMQHESVEVRVYRPMFKSLLGLPVDVRKAMAGNHDKLLIVDGEWLITGGRNIATEYFASPADMKKIFRDTDVVLQGKAIAASAKQAFDEEWERPENKKVTKDWLGNWESRNLDLSVAWHAMRRYLTQGDVTDPGKLKGKNSRAILEEINPELLANPGLLNPGVGGFSSYQPFWGDRKAPVVLLDKHSRAGDRNDITTNLIRLIDASKSRIVIQNPYIIFTREAREALVRASQRGVELIIHSNGPFSYDHLVTQATFLREWKGMLRDMPTARIFVLSGPDMIHAKVFVFDDQIAVVGSYNMDPLSENINSEEVVLIKSKDFARRNRERIQQDMKRSKEWRLEGDSSLGVMQEAAGPDEHAVQGALKLLTDWGLADLIRPII